MKLKSDGSLAFFIVLIIVFSVLGGWAEQKAYDEGYAAAKEEYGNYEHHTESCDGSCDHVQYEIEDLLYDGVLIRKDEALNEDDLEESYWEGAYDGYIQGYGDRHYGNERELDISEYKDEDMF